jgi:hypothetical protein
VLDSQYARQALLSCCRSIWPPMALMICKIRHQQGFSPVQLSSLVTSLSKAVSNNANMMNATAWQCRAQNPEGIGSFAGHFLTSAGGCAAQDRK